MKRKVTILLMMLLPMMVMGQDYRVQVDNVWYTMNGNYAKALSASNCSGDIVIPKTVTYYINGISHNATVIGIMEGAFARSAIQGVTIPNTVTSISSDAFRGCSQLASIVVEEGNSKYDSRDNCNAIVETGSNTLITGCKNTVIPNTVTTIDSYAFFGCTGLTALNIPNSVTTIGSDAFYGCTGLTTLTIPGNVTNVDGFSDCINLVTVIMQNGVTNIATNAFYGCSSLANVTFPNSVMSIGSGAFDGTAWYNNLPEGMVYVGNVAFSYKGTMPANTNLVFRDGTTGIAGSAFAGCTGIISVTIPNTVETIGSRAFRDCTNLMFATIGNSVTSIGDYAFDYCNYLTSVTVGMATPITITDRTFSNKSKAKLYVPNGRGTDYNAAAYWQDFKEIVEIAPSTSAPKISFADPIVKNICLDQWDTDGDRELSMQEAAAVTDLGNAFRYKTITSFDELQFFTGLTSIGNQAFSDCTNLTCVTIPSSVTSIGNQAFNGCINLTHVTIPSSVTSIGSQAFYNCSGLESITIPGAVTTIGNYAFYKCTGLVSLTIPNSVTSIGEKSFWDCSGLVSLAIEDAATSIGASAFNGCSNLASASLGNAVTSIGQSAFALCTTLSSIDIPNSISTIEGYTFYQCTSLANVTIPNSVTSIGSNVFYKCTSLENIVIPNTVTIIGQSAFEDCSGLKNITIPKSVTSIGSKAFYNTGIYTNASDGVFYVDKWACGYKGTMPSNATIAFDEGTYAVSASAFNSCNEIMEITIPNSVVIIDVMAFAYCSNLTTVTIGNSVTSIGSYAFDCSNLATVTVGATPPPTLGNYGLSSYFENNGSLYVPVGSKTAYKAADNWKNVLIIYENSPRIVFADATVKAVCVEKWDTDGDRELSEYEAGLVTSLDNAFYIKREQITSFDELRYFTGLTTIGSDDFNGCIALKSITIPSGVTTINPFAFNQSALETLSIDANNATFYSPSGSNAIINRSTKELVKGCKTTIIPDDVTSIGERAFYYCTGLTSVDIPNGVNSIADYAFQECSALVSVTIPNTVKSIGEMAFRNCPMTSINIPEGVETIGNNAFWNCTGLTSIVLPGSISSLGQYVFRGCTNLAIVTITDGIEAIGGSMFYSCRNLTSITIPSSVTSIGSSAFYGCSNLENITIPSSVASIGNYAFENCSALSSVTVEWQTPINISSSVFSNSNQSNATLYVPAGRVAAYKAASYWKNFNIKEQGTVWTVTSTDNIPAGTKYELDDITLTIGEAGSNDFTVNEWGEPYDETFKNLICGNGVNGNKEGGTFYLFKPKKNGNLTVFVSQNPVKKLFVEESGHVMDAFNGISHEEITEDQYKGTYTIPVYANLTYKLYCAGSKLSFYGFIFEGRNDADKTNIEFADEKVKALCVANWDTDHNGELSMAEAAAVTDLGEVFKQNEEITSFDELRFFTGLTDISGWDTFYGCHSLTSVTIPAGVTSIDGATFANCEALEHISVDPSNTKYCTLQNCNAIIERETNKLVVGCKTGEIPDGVTIIGAEAFHGSNRIQWIGIPESVTELEAGAFAWCISLEGVEIPSSVTKIGDWAFHQTALWSVTLPERLKTIGENAFKDCNNLNEVNVMNPEPVVLTNAETFSNCANATLNVPKDSRAAYEAAEYWKDFGMIVNVLAEENWADPYWFGVDDGVGATYKMTAEGLAITNPTVQEERWKLQTIVIQNVRLQQKHSYKVIVNAKIPSAGKLQVNLCNWENSWDNDISVNASNDFQDFEFLYEDCPYYTESGFLFFQNGCIKGTSVVRNVQILDITDGEEVIAEKNWASPYWFADEGTGATFTMTDEGLAIKNPKVQNEAWTPQTMILKDANLQKNHTYKVIVNAKIPSDGDLQMQLGSWASDVYEHQCIAVNASSDFQDLEFIYRDFPADAEGAFVVFQNGFIAGTSIVRSVRILDMGDNPVELVYSYNDEDHTAEVIKNDNGKYKGDVIIPATVEHNEKDYTVTTINDDAFADCTTLRSITIPATVTELSGWGFRNCASLEQITVSNKNPRFNSNNNCNAIIETGENKLIVGSLWTVIPESITRIGADAFWGRWGLATINIPNSVKEIGSHAFSWCFLNEITLPSELEVLEEGAFASTDLQSIILPASLKTIGKEAFNDCPQLTNVTVQNTVPLELDGGETFSNRANATLYLPAGAKKAYKAAPVWKEFKETVEAEHNTVYSYDLTAYLGVSTEMDINLENWDPFTAYQFDIVLPNGITLEKKADGKGIKFTKGKRCAGSRSISVTARDNNTYRVVCISTKNEVITGNDGALLTVYLVANENMGTKTCQAEIKNVIMTTPEEKQVNFDPTTVTITTKTLLLGDSNDDEFVNVTDLVATINYILGRPSDKFNKTAADISKNHVVDIFDVNLGLGLIKNGTRGARMMTRAAAAANDKMTIRDLSISAGMTKQLQVELTNEDAYTGFQFDLVLPEGIKMTSYSTTARIPEDMIVDYNETEGVYRFLGGLGESAISGNSGSIINITVKADENLKGRNLTGYLRDVKLGLATGDGPTIEETPFKITDETSGDMNKNGKLDPADVKAIVELIMKGEYNVKADVNGDNKVNAVDIVIVTNEIK